MLPPQVDRWISEEFTRLAEIIQDHDSYLELRWIPPHMRTDIQDKARPYCIVDTRSNYVVLYAQQTDTPVSILARLIDSDNKTGNVLKRIEAQNTAQELMQMKERVDAMLEAQDLAAFAIGNEKNYWKHNGIKFDSEFRRIE